MEADLSGKNMKSVNKDSLIKIAVCDDEKVVLDRVASIINLEFSQKNVNVAIDKFQDKQSLISSPNIDDYNIMFLDIDLKTDNGIDVAEELRKKGFTGLIIFITAFARYSIDGYKVEAFRFILKSNLEKGISECVTAIIEKLGLNNFCFEELNINISELIYIESSDHKLIFYLANDKRYECWGKLSDVEAKSEHIELIRIHQSYIINLQHFKSIERYRVTLNNGIKLPIPKPKYNDISTKITIRRSLWN